MRKMGICISYNSMNDFLKQLKNFENEDQKSINKKIINMKKFSRNFSIFKFYKFHKICLKKKNFIFNYHCCTQ